MSPPRVLTTLDEEGNKLEPIEEVRARALLFLFCVGGFAGEVVCRLWLLGVVLGWVGGRFLGSCWVAWIDIWRAVVVGGDVGGGGGGVGVVVVVVRCCWWWWCWRCCCCWWW